MKEMSEIKLKRYEGNQSFEGDKRTYMPYILEWKCSKCGHQNQQDFGDDYISYPPLGTPFDYEYLYCGECEHEEKPIKLQISMELILVSSKQREDEQ